MRRTRVMVLLLTAGALAVGGCASPGESQGGWSAAPTAELAPTGMLLTGTTAEAGGGWGAVVDGNGDVWTRGPWRLTRANPASGEATTWSAADDLAIGTGWSLVGSSGAGVWIKDQRAVRLFDGARFAADLEVPGELLQLFPDPEAVSWVRDVVEVGPGELWVALEGGLPSTGDDQQAPPVAGRIVRFEGGQWSTVSDLTDRVPDDLVVDADGVPWVLLRAQGAPSRGDAPPSVLRWDGSSWIAPAEDDPDYPTGSLFSLSPAPDGGVYALEYAPEGATVLHFDGTSWSTVVTDRREHIGEALGGDALAADATGTWVASSAGVAHVTPDGAWQDYGREQGIDIPLGSVPSVAVAGDRVVARTPSGLQVLSGGRFAPLWADPAAAVRTVGGLLGVSADEVWALVERPGERIPVPDAPEGVTRAPQGWSRYTDGTWTAVGGVASQGCPAARATDGAVWMTTDDGLVRWAQGRATVVLPGLEECGVVAGPAGSVWVTRDGEVVLVGPDGSTTSIGQPEGADRVFLQAAGTDGTVWVETECEQPTPSLALWDGWAWRTVDPPVADVWSGGLAVADDGALWAVFYGADPQAPGSGLARYSGGSWTTFPGWPFGVWTAPGGLACTMDDPEDGEAVNCYGPAGKVATFHVPQSTTSISVAPDAAIWILGDQVARLAGRAPSA